MAVVTTKAQPILDFESVPKKMNPTTALDGVAYISSGTVNVAAADDDTSRYLFVPVPSNACIKHIYVRNDAITAGTAYDIGLFNLDGTPADDDVYATAVDMSAARTAVPFDAAWEARDIINVNKKVWEDLLLPFDPFKTYYVGIAADTVGTAAGDITLEVIYTV